MATANDVMKNFVSALKNRPTYGSSAFDNAVKVSSSFYSWNSMINTMLSDCRSYNGDGESFLREKCGIILDNEDTGAITGSDAGGNTTKSAESVVPEYGSSVSPTSSTSVISGLTVYWPTGNLTDSQKTIVAGLNTWWIKNSLELINDSYGINFEVNDASIKEMTVNFVEENSDTLAYVATSYKSSGSWWDLNYTPVSLSLNINMTYFDNITSSDKNGSSSNSGLYLDRVIAHEMTHAVVSATLYNSYNFKNYFNEGIAELTHGIDDSRKYEILRLANTPDDLYSIFFNNYYTTTSTYAAGYMLLRYFANQASDSSSSSSPTGTSVSGTTMTLSSSFSGSVWLHGVNIFTNESVYANESIITIDGSSAKNNVILSGNNLNNTIKSGSGGSQLFGGWGGDDTLVGGAGSDMFWYLRNMGNDVIEDIDSNDTVVLACTNLNDISGIRIYSDNIYLSFWEGGSLNIKGAATAGNTFILDGQGSWKYNNTDNSWYSV